MAAPQPYYGQRYHGSESLSAAQLMFHRSPCSTDWLFLYHSMDASLRRAFLPLPRSGMKSKHGDILLLPESSTNDGSCWNAEKMVNQTGSYRLFNNAISFCSFSTTLWGMLAKPLKLWLGIVWIFGQVKSTCNTLHGELRLIIASRS